MIYFLRHGQTDWNKLYKCQGRAEVPLNDNGKLQAKKIGEQLKDIKIDKYFCSPLGRSMETFEIACGRKPNKDEIDERIIERDFGEFEGLKRNEFDFFGFWDLNSKQKYEHAESLDNLIKRAKDILDEINNKYANKNVLLVSHGGFGIVFISLVKGMAKNGNYLEVEMPHGEIIELDNSKKQI